MIEHCDVPDVLLDDCDRPLNLIFVGDITLVVESGAAIVGHLLCGRFLVRSLNIDADDHRVKAGQLQR